MWWGLLGGAVVGMILGGMPGAFAGAFLGWVIGTIGDSRRRTSAEKPGAAAAPPGDRLATLEARVGALEARLRVLESGSGAAVPEAPIAAAPAVEPPAEQRPAVEVPAHEVREAPPSEAAVPQPVSGISGPGPEPVIAPAVPSRANPVVAWLAGGNAIARVGIVVLFFGVAFLLTYAVEHSLFPPELRVASAGLGGIVLLALGWRFRQSRPGYALSLQGAGVGTLYLTIFGAFRLYGFVPAPAAFALLVATAALTTWLAVRQDSAVLAGFGAAGGFLAPVLTSTGRGDHVALFSYYSVLNLAILATAWFRSWRSLNLLGFAFTFAIGALWGSRYYRPEHFASTEPFLVFFFVLYVAVAVLFARRESSPSGRLVDGTLVFGVPLVGFGLQAGLVREMEYGLAWSSIALSAFYLALAAAMRGPGRAPWRLLAEAFLALGVVFLTLAIPLAVDARWTSAAWALEGAAVLWIGVRQDRRLAIAFGLLLQVLAGAAFLLAFDRIDASRPIANGDFLGAALVGAAGLFSHLNLRRRPDLSWAALAATALFAWSLAWWLLGLHRDIEQFLWASRIPAYVAVGAGLALGFALFHREGWREATWPAMALMPALIGLFLLSMIEQPHPFAAGGWGAWTFALGAFLLAKRRVEMPSGSEPGGYARFEHGAFFVLAAMLGAFEAWWAAGESGLAHTAWSAAAIVLIPCALVLAASSAFLSARWPLSVHAMSYRVAGPAWVLGGLCAWSLVANATRPGPSTPLPYLPLLNAIDLAHGFVALAALDWVAQLRRSSLPVPWLFRGRTGAIALGTVAFVWANGILLRSLHHWAGVAYDLDAWGRSFLVQTAFSIFWSVLALALMFVATRKALRALWMVGAGLMAVVVVKLVIVDLSALGQVERIVSFIGVGVLMLVIGYLSPVPPRNAQGEGR
jgi:uncharacterized membrane protein